jgi:hypothetical protein
MVPHIIEAKIPKKSGNIHELRHAALVFADPHDPVRLGVLIRVAETDEPHGEAAHSRRRAPERLWCASCCLRGSADERLKIFLHTPQPGLVIQSQEVQLVVSGAFVI